MNIYEQATSPEELASLCAAQYAAASPEQKAEFERWLALHYRQMDFLIEGTLKDQLDPKAIAARYSQWLAGCEQQAKVKLDNQQLRPTTDPTLLAEFDAEQRSAREKRQADAEGSEERKLRVELYGNDEPSLANWLESRRLNARYGQIKELGVVNNETADFDCAYLRGDDAFLLTLLSDETRARLLLDGKSIP